MKHLYHLFLAVATLFSFSLQAQVCTPNPAITSGISPTSSNIPCIDKAQSFSQTFTFVIPATVNTIPVTSATFDSVTNLPSGFTYQFSKPSRQYAGGEAGCFTITGPTSGACGQYKMLIYVTVVTPFITTPSTEFSALAAQYGLTGFDPIYLRVKDAAGTCPAVSANGQNFTPDQSCGIAGSVASVTTNAATNVMMTTATLNGTVNANGNTTTVTFEYGQTTNYGNTVNATPTTATGSSNTSVSANISGLVANTTYHFRVKGVNGSGTSNGNDVTFKTAAPAGACTPNTNQTTAFEPAPEDFQCAIKGSPYSETIFLNLAGISALVPFSTVRIDSITNLPANITALTDQTDLTYNNNEFGCIQFSGTTNAACGQYRVKIHITMTGTPAGTISGELGALATQFGLPIPLYYVRVASCAGACPDVDPTAGDFEANPNCPTPGVIAQPTISGATSFCAGGNNVLSVSGNYLSYKWSNGVLNQSTTVTAANTYTVTVSNGCDTAVASVTVTTVPSPDVTITQSGSILSVPANANATYQWLLNGAPVNNATGSSFTPGVSGNYSVDVTLGNCRDTSNAVAVTISSIEDVTGITLASITPNPAKTYININLISEAKINELKVMDMYGKVLKDIAVSATYVKESVSIEELPAGIYFIQVGTTKGKMTHSFVKQ